MAESATGTENNSSVTDPGSGIHVLTTGKPNRTYIQSDSKGKLESNATQPVVNERKKPHHRRPKQGQQNHSTEARKREVFTVETGLSRRGGGGGGRRQRGRQEYGGRRRERGEEREKEREGKEDREKKGREGEDREKQDREEAEREKKGREKKGREKKGREKKGREGEDREKQDREEAEREKKGREKKGREGEDREKQDREEAEREEKDRQREDRERREDGEELEREKKDRERKDGERERGKGRRYEENNPRKRVVQKVDGECGVPHEDYVSTKTVGEDRGSGRPGKRRGKRAKDESRHTKNEEGDGVVGKTAKGGERDVYDSEKMDSHNVSQKSQPKRTTFRERRTDGNWRSEGGDNEKVIGSEKKRYIYDDTLLERGEGRKERYMYDDTLLERGEGRKERLEKEGERRAHRRSGHSATHKRGKAKQVAPSLQSSELTEQLSSGSYSCMVCCERVCNRESVWSCQECYHVFHLECIRKWATSPASLMNDKEPGEGWRCPACQNPSDIVPTLYKCYCGKVTNPRPHRSRGDLTAPHSCGELCGRGLARSSASLCQHKCQLLCHPGPCPPCPVMVTRSCPCGRERYQVRCSKGDNLPSCGSECGRWLECGRHQCTQSCHAGECDKCAVMLTQQCHCGRSQRGVVCGETSVVGEERYQCQLTCGKELNCGNHRCELTCHPPPCLPCHLLPSHTTTCPCGAMPLSALLSSDQARTSCLDPIPTCSRTCGKLLPCSTKAEPHFCPALCHEGQCAACEKSRLVRCRCGRGSMRVDCVEMGRVGEYECDKPCNKMKSCGRHRCNTRCCVDGVHPCNLVCGKRLQCGNHYCTEQCHRGHCEQCWEYSYEELTCHCGGEVLHPPLSCGARPPSCRRVCARMHSCTHPVGHSCHNEEECPPCTVLTEKMCMGEHETRFNIPCHITDISCGMACGKDLPCGEHKCVKICHRGACMESPGQCRQPCQTHRKFCAHVCGEPCHTGSECPDVPCKAEVVLMCKCGRMKERVVCGASSSGVMQQAFHKILSKDLGAKIRDLQSGQSVSLARISLASLGRERETLDCDEVCAQVERNRALAEALGIASPVLDPLESPLTKYPPSLLDQARRDTAVAASIEEELKLFVELVIKGSGDQVRRHRFSPMLSHERKMVHELAQFYGCESLSYDPEPHRHVTVSTKKSRAKLPTLSLMKMVEREKQKMATPAPVSLPPERGPEPARISGPLEIERDRAPQKPEPVTDYFADDLV